MITFAENRSKRPCLLAYVQENNLDGEAELVKEQGFGGIGLWVLDGVNDPPEHW